MSVPWRQQEGFYGNGETFLFKLAPSFEVYHWNAENSAFFVLVQKCSISVGGGLCAGLEIDTYVERGSHCCFDSLSCCWALRLGHAPTTRVHAQSYASP